MLLITGATGTNGRAVLNQLAKLGIPSRALVREKSKASALAGPLVELVEGDFAKPETLDAALKGIESAFLLSSGDETQVAMQSNFVEAAQRAGLPRVVKLSVSGANLNSPVRYGRWHAQTEQQIREAAIPFTFLRPNFFMQNFLTLGKATIASEGKFYMPMKDARVSAVDVRDTAAVAVQALVGDGHLGQTYEVTGPTAVTFTEAAASLSAALGKPVTYIDVSPEDYKQRAVTAGTPGWLADALNEVFAALSAGYAADVADTTLSIGKKQPVVFDQFARDYAAAFQAA